ncbi:AT7L3 protein, partial [Nothocercus julius]|nr:AT7L3 protein [Nothocercus julius]
QAIAHEIYTELVEDACLGLCFEVHRAVKCGYFFLDDTDPDSMKDFGECPGTVSRAAENIPAPIPGGSPARRPLRGPAVTS